MLLNIDSRRKSTNWGDIAKQRYDYGLALAVDGAGKTPAATKPVLVEKGSGEVAFLATFFNLLEPVLDVHIQILAKGRWGG